jgi:transcriptional regulator with XRE-family HTH domain
MVPAPPVRRRLVGRTLRQYREGMGYTLEDVARMLECDRSKVSRIETGHRGIRGKELRELLAEYGVAGKEQAILELLANPRTGRGWFQDYDDVLRGAWRDYLTLEKAASKISAYEAQRVPGLLQTQAYARALAEADPSLKDSAARDSAAEATLARQRAILSADRPEVHLIIGQAALHQQVESATVMDEQLSALAQAAEDSGPVTVQIVPFDAGAHVAAGEGSLAILQFDQAPDLGLVHLGGIGGGVCLEAQNDLGSYTRAFERLRGCALSPKRSALMLRGMAADGRR